MDFIMIQFSVENIFYRIRITDMDAQANATIGTEFPRHRNQFAGNPGGLDQFLRAQCMADGFK